VRYVLDSNVALRWVLREIDSDKVRRLRTDYRQQTHELMAPDVFPIEVAHALARLDPSGEGLSPQLRDRSSWQTFWPASRTSILTSLYCGERIPSPPTLASARTIVFMSHWPSGKDAKS
jgi:hypothetical protein